MFNLANNIKFHNRYDVKVVEEATGKVKQEASAENAVLNGIWKLFFGNGNLSTAAFSSLGLGIGTETPSANDTGLSNGTHTMSLSASNTKLVSKIEEYPISTYVYEIRVPATTSYVGTFSEIGIKSSGGSGAVYWSHALFEDSEGAPIRINKTDLDVLIITYTVYVKLGSLDATFHWVHPLLNSVNNVFRSAPSSVGTPFRSGSAASKLMACTVAIDDDGVIMRASDNADFGEANTSSIDDLTFGITTKRIGTTSGNGNYYNSIMFSGIGGVVLPDTNVLTHKAVQNISVGVGDGETASFDTPVPMFVDGSDVVYINGTAQTRGIDYTINNPSNNTTVPFIGLGKHLYSPTNNYSISKREPCILIVSNLAPIKSFDKVRLSTSYSYSSLGGSSYGSRYKSTAAADWRDITPRDLGNIVVEKSSDGIVWEPLTTLNLGNTTFSSNTGEGYVAVDLEATLETKYIKMSLDTSTASSTVKNAYDVSYPLKNLGANTNFTNSAKPPQLTFTRPPAADAIITMDVMLDVPYKTAQFVLDAAMTLHFGDD